MSSILLHLVRCFYYQPRYIQLDLPSYEQHDTALLKVTRQIYSNGEFMNNFIF